MNVSDELVFGRPLGFGSFVHVLVNPRVLHVEHERHTKLFLPQSAERHGHEHRGGEINQVDSPGSQEAPASRIEKR